MAPTRAELLENLKKFDIKSQAERNDEKLRGYILGVLSRIQDGVDAILDKNFEESKDALEEGQHANSAEHLMAGGYLRYIPELTLEGGSGHGDVEFPYCLGVSGEDISRLFLIASVKVRPGAHLSEAVEIHSGTYLFEAVENNLRANLFEVVANMGDLRIPNVNVIDMGIEDTLDYREVAMSDSNISIVRRFNKEGLESVDVLLLRVLKADKNTDEGELFDMIAKMDD